MGIFYSGFFILSFILSLSGVFFLSRMAHSRRLLLSPGGVPVTGGLAIGLVFGVLSLLFSRIHPDALRLFYSIIPAASLALITGLWDDHREMSISGKVFTQLSAACLLVFSGVRTHIVYLNYYANIAVTVIWVIAITNSFNLLDIMDGLCAAITLLVAFALFVICVLNRDYSVSLFLVVIIGAVSGFLILNLPPAKVYMGNAGSHFLGFVMAALSISISYASMSRKSALISPVFIMGFPIFDTLFVSFMRMKNGKSAVKKSRDHLALRFLILGHSKGNALLFMSAIACFFTVCGILMSQVPGNVAMVIILVVVLAGFLLAGRMSRVSVNG